MVHGFDSISTEEFPAMICSVSGEGSLNWVAHSIQMFLLLTLSKSFLLILCAFDACLPLSSAKSYLVRFQSLTHSHDTRNQNFSHLILILLSSILMKQLTCNVSIISLIRICPHLVTFEQVTHCSSYCAWFVHCQHHLVLFCFPLALICFWFNLIVQFTSEFSLCCTDLCKVSIEDRDHVSSQIAFITEIEGNCFYVIFSILLLWCKSDLFTPLNITLSKLVFTSHYIFFYYIIICPVSSVYTIGVVSFA